MKKLSLLCVVVLVLAALCVSQVYAGDVTIPDGVVSGAAGTGNWYNQSATFAGEDQEVEPNCTTGKAWDLEGFALGKTGAPSTAKTLYTIGTFNFTGGEPGDPKGGNWTSGDIFIAIGPTVPQYGTAAAVIAGSGNGTIANSFGYNYVLHMNWTAMTFDIYAINSATLLDIYYSQNKGSNPYAYNSGGTKMNANSIAFSYLSYLGGNGLTDALILAQFGVTATDGLGPNDNLHNVVGTDLSSIWNGTDEIWFHFTMECGNDNLMGHEFGSVPLPPSALLLGTGLLGLMGLGWRRRRQSS